MDIVRLSPQDGSALRALYRTLTAKLMREGIRQWDRFYPNRFVIGRDLKRGVAYGIRGDRGLIGAVAVDRAHGGRSDRLPRRGAEERLGEIRRLAVHPDAQGRGIGGALLRFAESKAREDGCAGIRLDVFAGNPVAVAMYRKAGYAEVDTVRYPLRKTPYLRMEKPL